MGEIMTQKWQAKTKNEVFFEFHTPGDKLGDTKSKFLFLTNKKTKNRWIKKPLKSKMKLAE